MTPRIRHDIDRDLRDLRAFYDPEISCPVGTSVDVIVWDDRTNVEVSTRCPVVWHDGHNAVVEVAYAAQP